MGNALNRRASILLAAALCAACTSSATPPPTATVTPTATSHLSTHEGPVEQQTLPPSWTPTLTPTASHTPTPTPVTPTPVPSIAEVCASLIVDAGFEDGHVFLWGDTITVMFGTPLSVVRDPATNAAEPVRVRFLATHVESDENLGVQGEGGQTSVMDLAANRLTEPGLYTWKVVVYGDRIGEQCAHEGTFYVYPSSEDVPATSEATEEN